MTTKPERRIHTAITLSPEVLIRVDAECDAARGNYDHEKSRSTVIENYLRDIYGMDRIAFGRHKKKVVVAAQPAIVQPLAEFTINENPK